MPNHVLNEVVIHFGDEAERDAIIAAVVGEEEQVDFRLLLPLPLNIWWGDVSAAHREAFREPALDWCAANWSTKWNAYRQEPMVENVGTLTFRFTTAWSPPLRWILALFNRFSAPVDYYYFDEGRDRARMGCFTMTAPSGPEWQEADADDETDARLKALKQGGE